MSFWSDLVGAVERIIAEGPVQGGASAAATAITGQPVGGTVGTTGSYSGITPTDTGASLAGFVTVVEGIWAELTDVRMWASLGWMVLGIILIFAGALWWVGPSAERMSPVALAAEGLG